MSCFSGIGHKNSIQTLLSFQQTTLIVPVITTGSSTTKQNGQTILNALDLLISTFHFKPVARLDDRQLVPRVQPIQDILGFGTSVGAQMATSLEVFQCQRLGVSILRQAASIIPGRSSQFLNEVIIPFIDEAEFAKVIVVGVSALIDSDSLPIVNISSALSNPFVQYHILDPDSRDSFNNIGSLSNNHNVIAAGTNPSYAKFLCRLNEAKLLKESGKNIIPEDIDDIEDPDIIYSRSSFSDVIGLSLTTKSDMDPSSKFTTNYNREALLKMNQYEIIAYELLKCTEIISVNQEIDIMDWKYPETWSII